VDRGCGVGGGTTPPAVIDTALENLYTKVGRTGSNFTILPEVDEYAAAYTTYYEFPQGSLTGQPINEVGIFPTSTSGLLWSRFVLPDPVTLLADESLQINYTLYSYAVLIDQASTVSYDGVDYTVTVRPAAITNTGHRGYRGYTGVQLFKDYAGNSASPKAAETDVLPVITNGIVGGSNSSTLVRDAYVPGSKERTGWAAWYQDAANYATGWGMITLYTTMGTWHMQWSPKIPKDITKYIKVWFKMTWGRKT
jgi:hypothetical protein